MKNIKYVLLGVFITFIIIFITNVLIVFINSNRTIHINKYEAYDSTRETLVNKINKVKSNTCKTSLNNMLERIDSNHFTNDVKIKDYYESFYKDDKTFVDYYNEAVEACNIKNEQIYLRAMGTLVYPEQIKHEYDHSYELHIKYDYKNNDEVGTYSTLLNELGVLSDLLGELS